MKVITKHLNSSLSVCIASLLFLAIGISGCGDDDVNVVLSEREVLQIFLDENPGSTLGWVIPATGDVGVLAGVNTDGEGNVVNLALDGQGIVVLPPEFGQFTKLEILDLSFNDLTSLPSEFGQLSALTGVDLGSNELTSVPETLRNLSNLKFLTLTNNPITNIPQAVCDLQISNGGILNISTDPGEGCD